MKIQMGKPTSSFQQPYQDMSKKQHKGKVLQLSPTQERLSIEAAPKKLSMCIFHLRENNDGDSCPKMNRYRQLNASNELKVEYLESEDDSTPGDSGTFWIDEVIVSPLWME